MMLSASVAFFNVLIGNLQYIVFCLPFLAACIVGERVGKRIETLTLALIGLYVLVWQKEYSGMIVLYASVIWFSVYIHRDIRANVYIAFLAIAVAGSTYLQPHDNIRNIPIHAIMDSAFFAIGSVATLITLNNLVSVVRTESRPVGAKYFALLDSLSITLHEMLTTIKQTQEGAGHDRSRKDS